MPIILDLTKTEADTDWMRAARLRAKAEKGDKEAAEELARMEKQEMEDHGNVGRT